MKQERSRKPSTRHAARGVLLPLVLLILPSTRWAHSGPEQLVTRARYLMGTIFRFEAPAGGNPRHVGESLEAALDEVEHLEKVLSNWQEDSELSLLNARAGRGPIPVGPDLFDALEASLHYARLTNGAFDPALEPLTRRFRLAPGEPAPPAGTRRGGEWRNIALDSRARAVEVPAGTGMDLGGIGKGFALDRAAAVLSREGIHVALLDAGGQVLAIGSPPGEPGWRIAVADPAHRDRPELELVLRDVSASTSGNSERPGEILDPETGIPVRGELSATAIAPEATAADAFSTALFVLGPARGGAWTRGRHDVLAVYLEPGSKPGERPHVGGSLSRPPRGTLLFIRARGSGDQRSVHAEVVPDPVRRHPGAGDHAGGTSSRSGVLSGDGP